MDAVDRFRAAVEARDLSGLDGVFAPDVRFLSPVKYRPFEGEPMVRGLLSVLLRTFEDFRYVGRLAGEVEDAPAHILVFRAAVSGRQIHGLDLFRLDGAGRIAEFTVMVRPLSAVTALGDAVLAGLVAAGLAPAPEGAAS